MNLDEALKIPEIQSAVDFMRKNGYTNEAIYILTDAVYSVEMNLQFDDDEEGIRTDLYLLLCEAALKPLQ